MKPSFCAIANRQTGEDLIGSAGHYQTYVLIECPRPWAAKVFKSENIPAQLRSYVKALKAERSIQFLAISRGESSPSESVTVMVYERTMPSAAVSSQDKPANSTAVVATNVKDYRGYEFQVDSLEEVVDCLEAYWQGGRMGKLITQQDILVCTHGMRDKCCARFGHAFFREATHSAKQGKLPNTRLWKVSHIGGHRFAPTAISLPDGRYYGRLTVEALQAIVTRRGVIEQLSDVYRGWGLLPAPLQVLERQLMLDCGWLWFDCTVNYQVLTDRVFVVDGQSADTALPDTALPNDKTSAKRLREISVTVSVVSASGAQATYQARIVQDPEKTVCTKASCNNAVPVPIVKYAVAQCVQINAAAKGASSVAIASTASSKASSATTS